MGSAKLKPLAKPKANSVATPVIITGAQTESIPSATPPIIMVAGPVRAWSASSFVGANSLLVEYSVHFPISQPATSPTITLTDTPMCAHPSRTKVNTTAAPTIASVERLIPRANAAKSDRWDASS